MVFDTKYAACASRNLSMKKASETYGIFNYGVQRNEVEGALQKACESRNEVMEIAAVEEQAFLRMLGIDVSSNSDSEPDDFSTSCECASESEQSHMDRWA